MVSNIFSWSLSHLVYRTSRSSRTLIPSKRTSRNLLRLVNWPQYFQAQSVQEYFSFLKQFFTPGLNHDDHIAYSERLLPTMPWCSLTSLSLNPLIGFSQPTFDQPGPGQFEWARSTWRSLEFREAMICRFAMDPHFDWGREICCLLRSSFFSPPASPSPPTNGKCLITSTRDVDLWICT